MNQFTNKHNVTATDIPRPSSSIYLLSQEQYAEAGDLTSSKEFHELSQEKHFLRFFQNTYKNKIAG